MKTILIPIDFSDSARNAATATSSLARLTHSNIHLLHVVWAPLDWDIMSEETKQKFSMVESNVKAAETKLDQLSKSEIFDGLKVTYEVKTGVTHECIVDVASKQKAEFIIMGAHGAGETDALFVGSTAQRVIRLASCGVISLKKNQTMIPIKKIVFVSDFVENISKSLNKIIGFASEVAAELDLVYINTPSHFNDTASIEKMMNSVIPKQPPIKISTTIYNDFDRDQGILNITEKIKPQLIAITTHARKSRPLYQISVTDTLVFHSKAPILSYNLDN
ncbi:MAG TPA: universal stress protein [Fulvivirga sp.]|nr:universal stress protein [Fulvivirga sp.]